MDLSIGTVARTLDVSEKTVHDFIASGRLPAERKGQHLFISECSLRSFMEAEEALIEKEARADFGHVEETALSRGALRPVMYRLSTLERLFEERLGDLEDEKRRLADELKQKEQELFLKDLEIEKIKRDQDHQKSLMEKEIENREKNLVEKWAVLQKEATERVEQERRHIDELLAAQERLWMEKLAQEQARFARQLKEAGRREGFWSRLVRMMTWS